MNAKDRKEVAAILAELITHKDAIEALGAKLEDIGNVEQEKRDNMPDSLQESERAEKMQEAADALENAARCCTDGSVSEAIEYLEEMGA